MAERFVLHVDIDEFIAAVEILRRPELRGKPVVVGGDGDPTKRGVVSTANYEARKYGVHSAMPLRTAARRCPDAVFLPVDREAYEAASSAVMATLRSFPGIVEVAGWDEAFMEVTTDDAEGTARSIQRAVRERTSLSCAVGIGRNKLQAKVATGFGKPGGVFRLTDENWHEVMGGLPPDSLWGIGSKRASQMAELGIRTVEDLLAADDALLVEAFGPNTGPWYRRLAAGRAGSRVVAEPYVGKSRSTERTYQRNLTEPQEIRAEVARQARELAAQLVSEHRLAVRIVVKVRFAPFFTTTHGVATEEPSNDEGVLERGALAALTRFELNRPVRLLGVRAELLLS
jgi:nucleotidyltransferase/DNA polymerase involved in DNA repair